MVRRNVFGAVVFGGLAVSVGGGCGSSPVVEEWEKANALTPLEGCADVERAIRDKAIREMNARLDAVVKPLLERTPRCATTYDDGDPRSATMGGAGSGGTGSSPPSPSAGATNSGSGGAGAPSEAGESGGARETSGTNNQVASVDEADFVKNDATYFYIAKGQKLRIIKAWPATEMRVVGEAAIEGDARKLFVNGDRAAVYSSIATATGTAGSRGAYRRRECTYGYDCTFTGDGQPTKITIFNIANRELPIASRAYYFSGSYVNARRIGNAVQTVLSSPGVGFRGMTYGDPAFNRCDAHPSEIAIAAERLRAKNLESIRATPLRELFPSVTLHAGTALAPTENLLGSCGGFYDASRSDGTSFLSVVSFDMAADESDLGQLFSSSTIVSAPGAVYASDKALYVAVPEGLSSSYGHASRSAVKAWSSIHKFAVNAATARVSYAGSGAVKGRALNQFAMDERDGFLRIATTTGRVPSPDVHSTLTVLEQRGTALERVGIIDGLAPKEDIRSVRFDGSRGYVVTFKKTDPLFVFDLADPANPQKMAELKIPGFSTYMQMLDANHLLSIGYDADDHGSFAYFSGVLLQIFDVADAENPRLVQRHVIGTRGSSSEALTNHLAFTYFAPKKVLAIPMTICENGGDGRYGQTMTFSGLMVFDVSVDSGFSERGRVSHPRGANATCSNWWTNASSDVQRSIFMDDFVYSISDVRVKANKLDALSTDLAEILF